MRVLINALEAAGKGNIMKAIRKAPVTFGYMKLRQNQERAVCAFVRGLNNEFCLNACSACAKIHVSYSCALG